uniref:Uncharacterized protein n=1 Tax=Cacopsylla melanoneura TaxID=428564 RepID=A0A8D8RPK4_9HEMI
MMQWRIPIVKDTLTWPRSCQSPRHNPHRDLPRKLTTSHSLIFAPTDVRTISAPTTLPTLKSGLKRFKPAFSKTNQTSGLPSVSQFRPQANLQQDNSDLRPAFSQTIRPQACLQ